jgi:ribonuclease PH
MTIVIPMRRSYDRALDDLRPVEIIPNEAPYAEGSALIKMGDTHVLCTATVESSIPDWMKGKGRGWVTAEYAMLPRSSPKRIKREARSGKQDGRTVEIQRLIGRALRSVTDLSALGERSVILDCDVLRADGGTRCASITGAYVALALACRKLKADGHIRKDPMKSAIAAVSVGVVRGVPLLDLDYSEDSKAEVDANIVMTDRNAYVEIQGTAEQEPFSPDTLASLLGLANTGLAELFAKQREALEV